MKPVPLSGRNRPIAVVMKGYPRLSETFIAQEILALEQAGLSLELWSLRHPTDRAVHDLHRKITAPTRYLPEYLYHGPLRVLAGAFAALRRPQLWPMLKVFWRDLRRDPTPNRMRRLGQALVFARELAPEIGHIHVHYLHTPCSVVRYTALLTGRSFSFSAHAKDIWTTSEWEKREKMADARWGVTCTRAGYEELARLMPEGEAGRLSLVYHGLDLARFPEPPSLRPPRDGSDPADPVEIVSVGRAVSKKGFDDLIAALAALPSDLNWRLVHIGSGEMLAELKAQAAAAGVASRIVWRGALPQSEVIAVMRAADLFVLACKEGKGGDRDGLPNVLMEAATQALPLLSTRFAGVPEFIRNGIDGVLVPPADPAALATALERLLRDPARRLELGAAARARLRASFSFEAGIADLLARLGATATTAP